MINFLGINNFDLLSKDDILKERDSLLFVVTANAEIIVRTIEEKDYRDIVLSGHCTFDGQIPFILARIKNPGIKMEKLSGSDLIYDIAKKANLCREKIFLLGGLEESNAAAQRKLSEMYPTAKIEGFSPPFAPYPFTTEFSQDIQKRIKDFSPDYVFVGFGAGKQEQWIYDNFQFLSDLKVKVVIGSGGTFEFVSGKIKRAPKILQRIGLEGVFRLLAQPQWFRVKRIFKSLKIFYYFFKDYATASSLSETSDN